MRKHLPLILVVLLYLTIGALYAVYTPAWQAPDEPAHYNYVQQLVQRRLPVIEPGDYDQEYLMEVVFISRFAARHPLDPIEYEDWQPPLYYLLQAPNFAVYNGSLLALRILSLLFGAGVVILAHASVRRLFPEAEWLALAAAVFVAFIPQHLAMMSSVNNDTLAELLLAAILYVLAIIGQSDDRRVRDYVLLGLLLGLGYLTKASVYPVTIVIAVVLAWRFWHAWRLMMRAALLVLIPALLLGALWWLRNLAVYGGLDVLGKAAHDRVVVGQPRTVEWVAQYGILETAERFIETTFNSFWGQFGWMTVPMNHPTWLYPLLWLLTGVAALGLIAAAYVERDSWAQYTFPILLLGTLFILTLTVHIGYNVTFVQHQGRYLFPALVPIATGFAAGLGFWIRPLRRRWPPVMWAIPTGLALALIALDLYALFRVIVPELA